MKGRILIEFQKDIVLNSGDASKEYKKGDIKIVDYNSIDANHLLENRIGKNIGYAQFFKWINIAIMESISDEITIMEYSDSAEIMESYFRDKLASLDSKFKIMKNLKRTFNERLTMNEIAEMKDLLVNLDKEVKWIKSAIMKKTFNEIKKARNSEEKTGENWIKRISVYQKASIAIIDEISNYIMK